MTEQAPGQHLAETFLSTSNTHDPGLLDRSVAEDYRDYNACATDGREANRQFRTGFFAAIPLATSSAPSSPSGNRGLDCRSGRRETQSRRTKRRDPARGDDPGFVNARAWGLAKA
jgi:hypothetical protein